MEVSAPNIENLSVKAIRSNRTAKRNVPSFRGNAGADIATLAFKDMPFLKRFCAKAFLGAEKLKGEFINAIITAFGTACVAPIFITYNPFSKEDKEVRKYSAWRQPISAVIQFCTTLAIIKPFDKYINKMASTGILKDADLTATPVDSYVKNLIKSEHPEYTPLQLDEATKAYKENAFNKAVSKVKERYVFGQSSVADADLLGNKELDEYVKNMRKNHKAELKGLSKEQIHQKALRSVLDKIDYNAKETYELIKTEGNSGTVKSLIEKLDNEFASIEKSTPRKEFLKNIIEQLENLPENTSCTSLKKEFGSTLEEVTHNMKIKQLVKATSENVLHNFERLKLVSGIVVALAVLPVSCTILNWAYPRIMELIMPCKHKKHMHKHNIDNSQQAQAKEVKQ